MAFNRRAYLAALPVLILVASAAACATPRGEQVSPALTVERHASSRFEIDWVRIQRSPQAIRVSGEVSRLISRRGFIPGRVDVRVIGPDGAILAERSATPMRRNRQARSGHFSVRLPSPPAGSTVRIHHRLSGTQYTPIEGRA